MAAFDQLAALPRSQKIVLGLVPVAAIGLLGWFLLISPMTTQRDGLAARLQDLQAQVTRAQADEANLRQIRVQVEALRKRLEAAKERLPSERELPRLYRQINDLAAQAGVSVARWRVEKTEERSVYNEIPIRFFVEAPYHKVGDFFEKLGRLPRVVTLEDFKLHANDKPTGSVRAELILATYVFREEGPAPGAPRPGAAPGAPPRPGGPAAPGARS
jgi:type IV pilus assembly protein PilO